MLEGITEVSPMCCLLPTVYPGFILTPDSCLLISSSGRDACARR
jgi:hypothetical protein